jgi:ADP-heptose:LPS heptosyltransferase
MFQKLPKAPRIAILRALQLGDLLCSLPAIRSLRAHFPEAELVLIGLPWARVLLDLYPELFNGFITFPGYPGLPEQVYNEHAWYSFQKEMHDLEFDCILQLQGNGTVVNEFIEDLGANYVGGFALHHQSGKMNQFVKYPNFGHEINRHLYLMHSLGAKEDNTDIPFNLKEEDLVTVQGKLGITGVSSYVCVHPGSRDKKRQWPIHSFQKICYKVQQAGFQVILTGSAAEMELCAELNRRMDESCINAAGNTSLGEVAALLANAAFLVSNCTGVSHLAAAVKTRSIIISLDGEPQRWGPLNTRLHTTIDGHNVLSETLVLGATEAVLETFHKSL